MAYCATITLHDEKGEALHTIRYGRMPRGDTTRLCEGLCDDVLGLLTKRPDLRVVLLCDGAAELWNLLGEHVNETTLKRSVTRLVDFWHLIEKLGRALRVKHDEGESARRLARWKALLLNHSSASDRILAEIEGWGLERASDDEDPVHQACTFLRNQRARMNYAKARAAGLPIGSGNVEATCKSLFEVRMKRPGARWHDETGECIVQLRALALSDRWTDAMALTLAVPEVRIEPVRVAA